MSLFTPRIPYKPFVILLLLTCGMTYAQTDTPMLVVGDTTYQIVEQVDISCLPNAFNALDALEPWQQELFNAGFRLNVSATGAAPFWERRCGTTHYVIRRGNFGGQILTLLQTNGGAGVIYTGQELTDCD